MFVPQVPVPFAGICPIVGYVTPIRHFFRQSVDVKPFI